MTGDSAGGSGRDTGGGRPHDIAAAPASDMSLQRAVPLIRVRGARENNLQGLDVDVPLGRFVVFAGRSGSGKTSLALDTLHAEGQRRYLEALAVDPRWTRGELRRPDVLHISGLPPTIALPQRSGAPSARSTVASTSEIGRALRVLFATAGVQHCPGCGSVIVPRIHDEIVARILALPADSRVTLEAPLPNGSPADLMELAQRAGFSRVRVLDGGGGRVESLELLQPARIPVGTRFRVVVDRLRVQADRRERIQDGVRTTARAGRGALVVVHDGGEEAFVDRPLCLSCGREVAPVRPRSFSGGCDACDGAGAVDGAVCAPCEGTGIGEDARFVRVGGRRWADVWRAPANDLTALLGGLAGRADVVPLLDDIGRRVSALNRLDLGHLPPSASLGRLSAGEVQRLRLARLTGSPLSGVLFLLDEPTAGLGPRHVAAVIALLRELRDAGNSVVAIEHHRDVLAAADEIFEFGPGAGAEGGRIVFHGDVDGLRAAGTTTGRWLSGEARLPERRGAPPSFTWRDATFGGITAITGESATGKSTLLAALETALSEGAIPGAPTRVFGVDGEGGRRSARSNPATFLGIWDIMRELLAATTEAQIRGLGASAFSLNVKGGRCEACGGAGVIWVDLQFLPEVPVECHVCAGRRFASDVLSVRWKGLAPDELLALDGDQALRLLGGHPKLETLIRALRDTGLGYVRLGQALDTLSGGELARLRLARELARIGRTGGADLALLLDDPTVGLHPEDVRALLGLLHRFVDEGATVVVATHDAALAAAADHLMVLERR